MSGNGEAMTDMQLWVDPEEVERFRVAIDARTRHADLWPLVKQFGSAKALADEIAIDQGMAGEWINLKAVPSRANERQVKAVEALSAITNKSFDELWPPALREAIGQGVAASRKTLLIETSVERMALATAERMAQPLPSARMEEEERAAKVREILSRLRPRQRMVLEMRMDGKSIREIGAALEITKCRVRQIQFRAEEKLRDMIGELPMPKSDELQYE